MVDQCELHDDHDDCDACSDDAYSWWLGWEAPMPRREARPKSWKIKRWQRWRTPNWRAVNHRLRSQHGPDGPWTRESRAASKRQDPSQSPHHSKHGWGSEDYLNHSGPYCDCTAPHSGSAGRETNYPDSDSDDGIRRCDTAAQPLRSTEFEALRRRAWRQLEKHSASARLFPVAHHVAEAFMRRGHDHSKLSVVYHGACATRRVYFWESFHFETHSRCAPSALFLPALITAHPVQVPCASLFATSHRCRDSARPNALACALVVELPSLPLTSATLPASRPGA